MKKILAVTLLPIAFLVGACGSDDTPTVEGAGSAPSGAEATAGHNDADVEFAQSMIVHHQQAIEMSDVVVEKGQNEKVKALGGRIKAAQAPEIETMQGWLKDWGEKGAVDGAGHGGMDMGGGRTMMTEQEMTKLNQATGAELDRMFLEMMIGHHEGAIDMAETEVEKGNYTAATDLAKKIIEDQQAEIREMRTLLAEVG